MLKLQYHEYESSPSWTPILACIPDAEGGVAETCIYLRMGMNQEETVLYLQGLLTGIISFYSRPSENPSEATISAFLGNFVAALPPEQRKALELLLERKLGTKA